MTDSECGPSNALQKLHIYHSADRTLQQDRFSSRESSLQGFRSSTGSSSKRLESEFETFQNNAASLPLDKALLSQSLTHSISHLQQSSQPSSWVSDFKRMNFAEDPLKNYESIQDQTTALKFQQNSWHENLEQDYISSKNEISSTNNDNNLTRDATNDLYPMVNNVTGILSRHQNWLQPEQTHHEEILNEQEFDQAFELIDEFERKALEEIYIDSIGNNQGILLSETTSEQSSSLLEDNVRLTQVPIGADTIEYDNSSGENDQDSLSRIASRLLKSINNEQSKKFQNSQFLELMRRFRDKEATIQGDQIMNEKIKN
ncbi:hypothetical protein HI914_05691 [Erysiphe necator]|nr:hypothetical protein HI914_05691 [Erysiphe necator]